jgi:hypothetical protein
MPALAVFFACVFASLPQEPPTPQNLERWAAAIEPDATERAYEGIAWRNSFAAAMAEAKALGRPMLLWAMNGHPLGVT